MPQNYTLQNGKNVNFYVMYILSQNIISQKKKKKIPKLLTGASLVVQQLRLCFQCRGCGFDPVMELRCHMPHGVAKEKRRELTK